VANTFILREKGEIEGDELLRAQWIICNPENQNSYT